MSFLNYDLSRIPNDVAKLPDKLMDLLINDTFLDIVVILLCTIIYIGGSIAVVYLAVTTLAPVHSVCLWLLCILINNIITIVPRKLYGLCYLDDGNEFRMGVTMLFGPFGTLRLIALLTFFLFRVGPVRLLKERVNKWDYPGFWAQTFRLRAKNRKEEIRRIVYNEIDPDPKDTFRKIWAFLNKRIEIL